MMTGRHETSIDLICDWVLNKRLENLKLGIEIGMKMIKVKSI